MYNVIRKGSQYGPKTTTEIADTVATIEEAKALAAKYNSQLRELRHNEYSAEFIVRKVASK